MVTTIQKPALKKRRGSACLRIKQLPWPFPRLWTYNHFIQFQRIVTILNHPSLAFAQAKQHEDLLVSLMLTLGTPMIASILSENHLGSVNWMSALGVKIGANLGAWFVIAGVLQVAAPFLGKHWSFQRALSIAGLSWAPRALEAVLAVLYAFLAPVFRGARRGGSQLGSICCPALNVGKASPLMSQLDIFSLWSVGIFVGGGLGNCPDRKKVETRLRSRSR